MMIRSRGKESNIKQNHDIVTVTIKTCIKATITVFTRKPKEFL